MADDRRDETTSEDLVRMARERSHGDPTSVSDFVPRSPADSYNGATTRPADVSSVASDGRALTAEEIARELAVAPSASRAIDGEASHGTSGTPSSSTDRSTEPPAGDRPWTTTDTPDAGMTEVSTVDRDETEWAGEHSAVDSPPRPPGDRWSTSTPEWEAYEAQRQAKKTPKITVPRLPALRSIIGLAVLGFVAVGLIGSWLDGRQAVDDLEVGACFTVGDTQDVYDVPVVDCTEPHDSELFALVTIDGLGGTHPGDDPLFDWLFDRCLERFPGYVGEPYDSSDYYIDMLIPTPEGWNQGDRVGMCTAVVVDGDLNIATSTGSAHNAGGRA